VHGFEIRKYLN